MNILTSGYWNSNLGDDLFLKILSERYPAHNFFIISGSKAFQSFNGIPNVKKVRIPLKIKLKNKLYQKLGMNTEKLLSNFEISILNQFDLYCEVGGSLFILPQEGLGTKYSLRKRIELSGLPYFVIGSNFGPYFSERQVQKYHELFADMTGISLRDYASYKLFSDLPNVDYASDLVFNLKVKKPSVPGNYTLISIINPEVRFDHETSEKYYQLITNIITSLLNKHERIVLMSFCEAEGDLIAAKKIKKMFNNISQIEVFNHTNIDESLEKINSANKIVATRYHSMILGWLMGKPTFVLSYSEKINNVISDLFPTQPFINISQIDSDNFRLSFAVNNQIDDIVQEAQQQFKFLDRFFKYGETNE
ncbi:MAG: polysaccharide pyruvyl transferase family protein [Lactobacillus sp.]|nr:polysaccharide pyruvyl transferase family protein [Lactobacillus sp.]